MLECVCDPSAMPSLLLHRHQGVYQPVGVALEGGSLKWVKYASQMRNDDSCKPGRSVVSMLRNDGSEAVLKDMLLA